MILRYALKLHSGDEVKIKKTKEVVRVSSVKLLSCPSKKGSILEIISTKNDILSHKEIE